MLSKDLVGEFGACFEGEALREDEGVVAVEKDVFDFWHFGEASSKYSCRGNMGLYKFGDTTMDVAAMGRFGGEASSSELSC